MKGKPAHRSQIPIDWERVDEMLACGCIGTEIAACMGMHPDTLYRRVEETFSLGFTAYATQKRSVGEKLLRETQFKKACGISKKGDNTLLIWLGKQRLGQKENTNDVTIPEDLLAPFLNIMGQIKDAQSERKKADKKSNSEQKSE